MAGEYLLDTNILIAYFERETNVVERILKADVIYVPPVVLGELHYGAANSRDALENEEQIKRLLTWAKVAPCNEQTAVLYGIFKLDLRRKGRIIPDNDIWVAASARQTGATLVSRDRHFGAIEHIVCESWQ